jgi:ABC-type branched-subunit amino acid transport system ATPase component
VTATAAEEHAGHIVAEAGIDPERDLALAVLEEFLPPHRGDSGNALVGTGLSIAFGGVKALQDVTITAPSKTFVGLLGPNGAGKSTCFDVLNGLKTPDSGTITMFGKDVTKMRPWDRARLGMGRTFQANRLNHDLTVGENLLSAAHLAIKGNPISAILGLPGPARSEARAEQAAYAMCVLLGIKEHWHDRVSDLDFGRQRRIEIGRSLMCGPAIVLLDEPAAGLDAEDAHALFALLRQLQRDLGLTIILVEHYVKAVLENADLVYVLNQGQLLASGTPAEVAADPTVRSEYLGSVLDLEQTPDITQAETLAEEADEVLAEIEEAEAAEAEAKEPAPAQGSDENA